MRLHVNEDADKHLHRYAEIYLDDVQLTRVIMADEELGEVEVFAVDASGSVIVVGDEVKTVTYRGRVRILDSRTKQPMER